MNATTQAPAPAALNTIVPRARVPGALRGTRCLPVYSDCASGAQLWNVWKLAQNAGHTQACTAQLQTEDSCCAILYGT